MGLLKPGEEFDGFGDLLFRRADGPVGGLSGRGVSAEPIEVVPGGELFNRAADGTLWYRVEFCGQPGFEPGEVLVTYG